MCATSSSGRIVAPQEQTAYPPLGLDVVAGSGVGVGAGASALGVGSGTAGSGVTVGAGAGSGVTTGADVGRGCHAAEDDPGAGSGAVGCSGSGSGVAEGSGGQVITKSTEIFGMGVTAACCSGFFFHAVLVGIDPAVDACTVSGSVFTSITAIPISSGAGCPPGTSTPALSGVSSV